MKLIIFFLTIGPTSFIDLPKKNIKSSKVQTKNYFKLNLIELFFFDFEFERFVFLRKKNMTSKLACR